MPDAPTAIRWPLNTDSRVRDMLDHASPAILARLDAVRNESVTARAKNHIKAERISERSAEISELGRMIAIQENNERKLGPARKEVVTPNKNGGVTVEVTHTNELAGLKKRRDALIEENKKERITKRRDWHGEIMEGLANNSTRELVEESDVIEWQPNEGEDPIAGHEREWNSLYRLLDEETQIWNAPRTVAEVTERAVSEMVARCKPIDFGGFRRGHSFDHAGNKRIATPTARVGFPVIPLQAGQGLPFHDIGDGIGLFLSWLGPKKVEAWTRDQIAASYTDEGAISEADKRGALAEIAERIWRQRRVVEAAHCYCRDKGITNLNRPKTTPVEIILGVIPFSKSPQVRLQNMKPVENEDEFTAADFEGDDTATAETAAA